MSGATGLVDFIRLTIDTPRLFREIQEVKSRLEDLERRVIPNQQWFTREEVARLKGVKKSTLDNNTWLYPCFNRTVKIGHRDMFRRDDVMTWLPLADEKIEQQYESYLQKLAGEKRGAQEIKRWEKSKKARA